jgi:hypothetical protein
MFHDIVDSRHGTILPPLTHIMTSSNMLRVSADAKFDERIHLFLGRGDSRRSRRRDVSRQHLRRGIPYMHFLSRKSRRFRPKK